MSEACCASGIRRGISGRSANVSKDEPTVVTVVGAAGQVGYALLPMIASGDMFGHSRRVVLQCLDLNNPQMVDNMKGLEIELRDASFPLLHRLVCTTDDSAAFKDADYAILLGAFPSQPGVRDEAEVMEKNVLIFKTMGSALDKYAKSDCKVLVVGNPANTNALICASYAEKLSKHNFFALSRLDQNRAAAQIAERAACNAADVKNIIVWGANAKALDIDHCTVVDEALADVLHSEDDQTWLSEGFDPAVLGRAKLIHSLRHTSCALSASRAIVDTLRDLHFGTRSGEFVSLGVWSNTNQLGIDKDLIFSMPVQCLGQGRCKIATRVEPSKAVQEQMKSVETDLIAERKRWLEVKKRLQL